MQTSTFGCDLKKKFMEFVVYKFVKIEYHPPPEVTNPPPKIL